MFIILQMAHLLQYSSYMSVVIWGICVQKVAEDSYNCSILSHATPTQFWNKQQEDQLWNQHNQ